jgi:tryptophan synthase alpha chain
MIRPRLETHLRAQVAKGKKLLVPYLMAGQSDDWLDVVQALAEAGADAIEIGLPFSDPIMDGPVIQEAAVVALERGTTPESALSELGSIRLEIPLVVMTYYNLIFRAGHERFAGRLAEVGVSGCILPDLSLEEMDDWGRVAERAGVDTVLLVAPSTSIERAQKICDASRGFVYAVGRMGVTGERAEISHQVAEVVEKVKPLTTLPICVGVGVSNPAQAAQVTSLADGAVVGSALVRRLLEGSGPEGAAQFISSLRQAIDTHG